MFSLTLESPDVKGFKAHSQRKVSLQLGGRHILGSKKNYEVMIQEGWQTAVKQLEIHFHGVCLDSPLQKLLVEGALHTGRGNTTTDWINLDRADSLSQTTFPSQGHIVWQVPDYGLASKPLGLG